MVQDLYQLWSTHPYFDGETHEELLRLANDPREVEERFYRSLGFGTGGLRGVLGAGTNRMNRYTVRLAAYALGQYISSCGATARKRGVAIAYDSRYCSREFALEAALTLGQAGITAYIWDSLRPTPMLSFTVRELGTIAGIVITASHNPPQYNGFKVYWEGGGQVPPERAAEIEARMRTGLAITAIVPMAEESARASGLLRAVPPSVDQAYYERLQSLLTVPAEVRNACTILYTPLHGSGHLPVKRTLADAGFQVRIVAEQAEPDPAFPTVSYPNPEEPEVFTLALRQAEAEQPDVIMATDPDADRLGVYARDRLGAYQLLTGNQIGALLVDYLLRTRAATGTLPTNAAVIKTIVTSNMVRRLCVAHGVTLMETLTGFKYIGEKIREFEQTGDHTFLFGFEESYGYLGATFVRDKDAVMSALLFAEATAYHKAAGRTIYEALERMWATYGYFCEALHNVTLPGKEGQRRIGEMMAVLRQNPPVVLGGLPIACTEDYTTGTGIDHQHGERYPLQLGRADVLHFRFADGGFVSVRPSGTEPKLKIYVSVVGSSLEEAQVLLHAVTRDIQQVMGLA